MNNIVHIEFWNKKGFPPGLWMREPDFCYWYHASGNSCLVIRDMSLGNWKGFVGVNLTHPFYFMTYDHLIKNKLMFDIFILVYGGINSAGKLPPKIADYTNNLWWFGIDTSHGGDLLPLCESNNIIGAQTYKDFFFIRKETNKLARYLSKIK